MLITVIGTGYVELVTGACFAEFGNEVTRVDIDAEEIARLNEGVVPVYEPGLDQLVKRNVQAGRLHFTINLKPAVEQALMIFLAVGTPSSNSGSIDLSFAENALRSVAEFMESYKVIVVESEDPVGTGEYFRHFIRKHQRKRVNFGVVSNRPYYAKASTIDEFMPQERAIISSYDAAVAIMRDLYRPLLLRGKPFADAALEATELGRTITRHKFMTADNRRNWNLTSH